MIRIRRLKAPCAEFAQLAPLFRQFVHASARRRMDEASQLAYEIS